MNQCTEKWFPGRGTIEEFSNNTKFLIILVLGPTPFFTKQMCWREAIVGAVRRLGFKSQICVLLYGSCCSVVQLCLTLCNPMNCSTPGLPVHHHLPELIQTHVHRVGDAIQPSHPCHPPLLPPSIFPSIRVFSRESALHIRWPKYWSFSFSISPSKEYSGLIFFSIDLLDL